MRGLSIDLNYSQSRILVEEKNDFDLVLQNTLVNLGQAQGTSKMFPEKGTELLKRSLSGYIIDGASASMIGGLAAVNTLYFVRAHEISGEETLANLSVAPGVTGSGDLNFKVGVQSTLDREVGLSLN